MVMLKVVSFVLLFFSLHNSSSLAAYCTSEEAFILQCVPNSGVLEANGESASLQRYSGNPNQLWKFECSNEPGTFYIVNVESGMVLDVNSTTVSRWDSSVIVHTKGNSLYQRWYLQSDTTIVNADLDRQLYSAWADVGGPLFVAQSFVASYNYFLITNPEKIH